MQIWKIIGVVENSVEAKRNNGGMRHLGIALV